jgi:hypothetical protein
VRGIGEGPLGAVLAQFDEGLERVGGVLMERDDPLFIGLASRQPQPRCPIGVVVQAVDRQVPDLVAARPRPVGDQQRCPLEGAGDLVDDRHHQLELVVGDEAGGCVWAVWARRGK